MDNVSTMPPSMAQRTLSTLPNQLQPTTPQFPPEILLPIFRELHKLQPLSELRLVARQFYGLATPIYYNHVTLTDRLIPSSSPGEPQSELGAIRSRFALCMQSYTENVTFECLLERECEAVLEFLMSLARLRSTKWSRSNISRPHFNHNDYDIFHSPFLRLKRPMLRFFIEGLDMRQSSRDGISMLPEAHIVSFKLSEWITYENARWRTVAAALKRVIVSNPELRTLHLTSSYNVVWTPAALFRQGDQLPAVRELVLHGCNWFHLKWNLSNIAYLDLQRVFIVPFMQSVERGALRQLRTFMTDGHCSPGEESKATDLICELIGQIHALEKLSITVQLSSRDCVQEIFKHGPTLHTLEVQNYAVFPGFYSTDCWNPQGWTLEELNSIRDSCPRVMELGVDCTDPTMIVESLASFRNLRRLTVHRAVHNQTFAGRKELLSLTRTKQGAQFEKIMWDVKIWNIVESNIFTIYQTSLQEKLTYTYRRTDRTIEKIEEPTGPQAIRE